MTSRRTSRTDAALLVLTGFAVFGLALVAGAISFAHMSELAAAHDQTGWKAFAFPISVDGLEVVASLYLVVQHRAHRPTGWMPWITLAVGTTASLSANVAVGGHDLIGRSLAGWPALSMLVSVKLLSSMFDRSPALDAGPLVRDDRDDRDLKKLVPDTVRDVRDVLPTVPDNHRTAGPSSGDTRIGGESNQRSVATLARGRAMPVPGDRAAPVDVRAVADLLPAGRSARSMLMTRGQSFSRDNLAITLRAEGCAVSNARVSLLVKLLRAEGHNDAADRANQQQIHPRPSPLLPPT